LKPVADVMLRVALQRLIRSESFDVIHAHNYEGLWVALQAQSVLPIVYHAHNAMADELPYFLPMKKFSRTLGRWLDNTLPARADHIIALHQPLADYLVDKGCKKDRITVIPPPCDTEAFAQGPDIHPSSSTPFVLYAGNLDTYQNLDLLRRAMARVKTILPEARLHIATSDRADVPWADHVCRITNFAALREILAQDCIVVCPRVSWSGYPIKIVNAMAAGKPIVACRSSAHSLQHMINGYIVEDNDCISFAEALILLIKDPALRRRLGKEARRTACERHSFHAYATAIMDVYDRACQQVTSPSGEYPPVAPRLLPVKPSSASPRKDPRRSHVSVSRK